MAAYKCNKCEVPFTVESKINVVSCPLCQSSAGAVVSTPQQMIDRLLEGNVYIGPDDDGHCD